MGAETEQQSWIHDKPDPNSHCLQKFRLYETRSVNISCSKIQNPLSCFFNLVQYNLYGYFHEFYLFIYFFKVPNLLINSVLIEHDSVLICCVDSVNFRLILLMGISKWICGLLEHDLCDFGV